MRYFLRHPFKALKAYLPKSMFGRSLLILVAPLMLVETISAYVFFDNHWEYVTKALANVIAGEVATVLDLYNHAPEDLEFYKTIGRNHLKLKTTFIRAETLPNSSLEGWRETLLDEALNKHIFTPYSLNITLKNIVISAEVKDGILQIITPRKRLFSKTFFLFIMWVAGTSAFFLFVAAVFMHNQVKPLRRLAIAADRFGKGRSFPYFKPEGATEIRKVAQAFMDMKERLHRQLTQRTEMLAGVSHDLRTPLTRMRLQLAMMPASAEVNGLQKDVDEMGSMLEGYLTFARGEGLEETCEVDVNDLLMEAIGRRVDLEKNIHYTPHPLPLLSLKPQAFKRCLINLINNALRYGQEVWITAFTDRNSLTILIEDDGPGIPEEKHEDVFKPFFRLDPSRNMTTGGVGLGLTIARDIIHSHGGDIMLSPSHNHGGLQVTLLLPY